MRVKWVEEEIRLLLNYYMVMKSGDMHKTHPLVIKASKEIRDLPINKKNSEKNSKFRNPNGVALKMANFLFLDPNYSGKGMKGCSNLDKKIFNEIFMIENNQSNPIKYNKDVFPFKFYNWFSSMSGGVRRPLDKDSGRPLGDIIIEGRIHDLIKKMIDDYIQSNGIYICVLVGGPGNGKTDIMEYAAELFVSKLGMDWDHHKSELQNEFKKNNRQSFIEFNEHSLLLTQDASQRDINSATYLEAIYNDFEKIKSFKKGLAIICMNRGILEEIKKESNQTSSNLFKFQNIISKIYKFNTLDSAISDLKIWGTEFDLIKMYTWSMDFDTLFSKANNQNIDDNLILNLFEKSRCIENFYSDDTELSPILNALEFIKDKSKNLNLSKTLRCYEILNGKRFTYRELFSLIGYLFYFSESDLNSINRIYNEISALSINDHCERFVKLYQLYQLTCNYRFFNNFIHPTDHLKVECQKAFKGDKIKKVEILFDALSQSNKITASSVPKFILDEHSSYFDPMFCSNNITFQNDSAKETNIEILTKKVIYNSDLNIDEYSKLIPKIDREMIHCLEKIKSEFCLSVSSDNINVTMLNALDTFKSFLNTLIIATIKRGLFFSEHYMKDKEYIDRYLKIIEGDNSMKQKFVNDFSTAISKQRGGKIEVSLITSIGQTPNQFKTNISIEARPYSMYPLRTTSNLLPSNDQIILQYKTGISNIDKYIVITYKLFKEIIRSVDNLLPGCLDQNFQLWKELKMSEISDKDDIKCSDTIKIDSVGEIKIIERTPHLKYHLIRNSN